MVHTINNAALVTVALLFSGGDFEKAITTAVLVDWDTDCNGAIVGSIVGVMTGAKRLPNSWIDPLQDTLYAEFVNFHPIAISTCTEPSYAVFRSIQSQREQESIHMEKIISYYLRNSGEFVLFVLQ